MLLVVLTVSACASRVDELTISPEQASSDVRLTVKNDNYSDAVVHANWGGVRERLALVTGKSSATMSFRWRRDEVWFEVAFLGDGSWETEVMQVSPGDHLDLQILPWLPVGRDERPSPRGP
jgi:hypothetical protein